MHTITSKSGKDITFRTPQASDLEALFSYAKTLEAEDTFITLNPQEPLTLEEEGEYLTALLKDIKKKKVIHTYALHENKIIGNCSIKEQGKRKHHVGLLGIALIKEFRGDGIGTQLLNYTLKQAQEQLGIKVVLLEHFIKNQAARNLYEKLGFRQVGILPKVTRYQGEYIDEAIMVKILDPALNNETE